MDMDIDVLDAIQVGIEFDQGDNAHYLYAENYNPLGPVDMLFKFKDKNHLAEIHRVAGPRERLSSVPITFSADEDFIISFSYDGHNYLIEGSVYPYDSASPIELTLKITKFL